MHNNNIYKIPCQFIHFYKIYFVVLAMDCMVKMSDLIDSMENLHRRRTRLIQNYVDIVRVDGVLQNISKCPKRFINNPAIVTVKIQWSLWLSISPERSISWGSVCHITWKKNYFRIFNLELLNRVFKTISTNEGNCSWVKKKLWKHIMVYLWVSVQELIKYDIFRHHLIACNLALILFLLRLSLYWILCSKLQLFQMSRLGKNTILKAEKLGKMYLFS